MKKVYIPTDAEIQQLEYLGFNPYSYLLAKTVEALIMEDVIYENSDMFDYVYRDLSDIPEILYSIYSIYPERIARSDLANKDVELWRILTKNILHPKHMDDSIYQLDILTYIDQESDIITDPQIIENVSSVLVNQLTSSPKFRFNYKEPNIILDNIFACELPIENLTANTFDDLLSIDPIYITKLGLDLELVKKNLSQNKAFAISRGMARYKTRYNIERVNTTNQTEKTKKLLRCLENHSQNFK